MRNPVGWFEIYVQNMERAKKFYETVLGCELTPMSNPGSEATGVEMMGFPGSMTAAGASGALARMDGFKSGDNSVLIYFSCADCSQQAARAAQNGGKIHREKMSIGQYGFIALVTDTEGNMIGLHSLK